MEPDKNFVKELKAIDKKLSVSWNIAMKRFVIFYKNSDGTNAKIMEVKNGDNSFRPLDQRTIDTLRRCDMTRYIDDPTYILSEQYRKREEWIAKEKARYTDEALQRSRQIKSKWIKAVDNAQRGIFTERQAFRPMGFSMPSKETLTQKLLKKLGKPYLPGRAVTL